MLAGKLGEMKSNFGVEGNKMNIIEVGVKESTCLFEEVSLLQLHRGFCGSPPREADGVLDLHGDMASSLQGTSHSRACFSIHTSTTVQFRKLVEDENESKL